MNKTMIKTMLMFALAMVGGAAWAVGESINIKFNSGTFDENIDYGCYPVKGSMWRVVGGGTAVNAYEIDNGVTVSYTTSATWSMSNSGFSAHMLLDSYLDDGVVNEGGTTITISGLDTTTFADYDLLIYVTADTTPDVGKHFRALTVNGTQYTYGKAGEDNWGTVHSYTKPIIGVNCLKVEGLHATAENNTLTIEAPGIQAGNRRNGRACISAVQIVKANSIPASVFDMATSQWTFENSIADLRGGVPSWTGDDNAENAFLDSLRKNDSGVSYKAAKMSSALHPYAGYAWPDQVTIAMYANVEKCPDNGVLVSSGGKTKLRKLDNTRIKFGGDSYYCTAELSTLSEGYHLIIASRDVTNGKLSLQIDGREPVVFNNASDISNGIQIGAEWGGGTHSYNDAGGAIIDDVLIWNKILTVDEISELVALYPTIVPMKLTGVGPHRISDLIENGLSSTDIISLEDGAILNIDAILEFKVPVISTGAITVKITNPEITLEEAQEIVDLTRVEAITAFEIGYHYGYTAEDGKNYARIFYGTEDAFWGTPTNWYVGTIDNGVEVTLIPQPEDTPPAPATVGSNKWDPVLIDGDLIGSNIAVGEDNFKTIICTNVLEGWNLRLGVMNGVHVIIDNVKKLQSETSNNNAGWITVDETSKLTIGTLGSQSNNTFGGQFNIFGLLVVTNDFTASGNNPGYNYSLGKSGKVEYQGLSSARTHNIKSVVLDLGDSTLEGKTIISRQLIAFTNQVNQTFAYDSNGVTSTVDQAEVAFRASLANVGEYNFEVKADGYYVNYVAYNETDDINVVSTWTPVDANSQWTDETLWSNRQCPDSGDIVIDTSRLDADISISIGSSFDSVMIMGNAGHSTNVDFSNAPDRIEIYGKVSVKGVNPENLIFGTGSEVVINNVNSNDVTVPSGATVILNGAEAESEEPTAKEFGKFIVSQGGCLKTRGYLSLTLQSNGEFEVCDGTAVVAAAQSQLVKGIVTIKKGATLESASDDAVAYNGSTIIRVYGELNMSSTRWTIGGSSELHLYGGALVYGSGDGSNGILDFYRSGNVVCIHKSNDEIPLTTSVVSGYVRVRNGGAQINIDEGAYVTFSGGIGRNPAEECKLTRTGDGGFIGTNYLKGVILDLGKHANVLGRFVSMSGENELIIQGLDNGNTSFCSNDTKDDPVIKVESESTLKLSSRDYSGWNGSVTEHGWIVNNGTLKLAAKDGGSRFFREHIVIRQGANTIAEQNAAGENNQPPADRAIALYGGAPSADLAQIQLLEGSSTITTNGTAEAKVLYLGNDSTGGYGDNDDKRKGAGILVGKGAELTVEPTVKGGDKLVKWGDGMLKFTGPMGEYSGRLTLNRGKISIAPSCGFTGEVVTEAERVTVSKSVAEDGTVVYRLSPKYFYIIVR